MTTADTNTPSDSRSPFLSNTALLLYLALFKLILHVCFSGMYGYFRDELYFIDCSKHVAWGYVDQPPFSIFILEVVRLILGDSLYAIRFPAAVVGSIVVFLSGMIARKLGGDRFAQMLAAMTVLAAPVILGQDRYFSMNAFDFLFWTLAAYLLILIVKDDNPRWWPAVGVVIGLGLLNKYSMGFFCIGLAAGLLLTPHRKYFKSGWFWMGVSIATLIFLPHVLWEYLHGLPSLEFMRNAEQFKNAPVPPLEFFLGQMREIGFATAPVWILGLYSCFFYKDGKKYRMLGWMYIIIFIFLVMRNAKVYYLSPVYPMLLAVGAVFLEMLIRKWNMNWFKSLFVGLVLIMGLISAPFAIPILPVETFLRYQRALGQKPKQDEHQRMGALPQHFADMFGWEDMVGSIAKAFHALTAEEQIKCAIVANNYGEAGAIDFFGGAYHLPEAISGHNNYWIWGPRGATGEIVIRLGGERDSLRKYYGEVIPCDTIRNPYCMPYENNLPVYICKKRFVPLTDSWSEFKSFQ